MTNTEKTYRCCWYTLLAGTVCMVMLALSMCSCTTTQYVPVIEHKTDTLIQTRLQRDSIYLKDSTHVSEKQNGDTLVIERDRWHTLYKYKQVRDTTYISKTDSVPAPYPVIKEVPRQRSTTEKALAGLGMLTLLGGIIWIAWKLKRFLS